MRSALVVILTISLLANFIFAAVPDGTGPWADSSISTAQGMRKDGSAVLAARSNPAAALGVAESTGTPSDSITSGFYSLGFGGSAVFGFDNAIINGDGNDLMVYEVTGGVYPEERVKVEASLDGTTWVVLSNSALRDASLDLGTLECAKFVRVTDVSNKALFSADADGYDLDAIKALNSAAACPVKTGPITGTVYNDFNQNGQLDSGEAGIGGMTVSSSQNSSTETTTTETDGTYEFVGKIDEYYDVAIGTYPELCTLTTAATQNVVVPAQNVDFGLYCSAGEVRTIGFWKHQFNIATGGKGTAQIDATTLSGYLPISVFGTEVGSLSAGYNLLWLKKATMQQRALQQCFATQLNALNGQLVDFSAVDTNYDGVADMSFASAMDEAQTDFEAGNYEAAKSICDSINNMSE